VNKPYQLTNPINDSTHERHEFTARISLDKHIGLHEFLRQNSIDRYELGGWPVVMVRVSGPVDPLTETFPVVFCLASDTPIYVMI